MGKASLRVRRALPLLGWKPAAIVRQKVQSGFAVLHQERPVSLRCARNIPRADPRPDDRCVETRVRPWMTPILQFNRGPFLRNDLRGESETISSGTAGMESLPPMRRNSYP